MGVCNCSMFCCTLLYVHSCIAIILMGKRELIALLNLSSWCLVMVERLFLAVPRGCLQFVIVVFPDHTHLLFIFLSVFCLSAHGHVCAKPPLTPILTYLHRGPYLLLNLHLTFVDVRRQGSRESVHAHPSLLFSKKQQV